MTAATEQRMAALNNANTIRAAVKHYKQQIALMPMGDGALAVAAMLTEPITPGQLRVIDGPVGSVKVGHLLCSIHRLGSQKSTVMLRDAGVVSADRHVRDLTRRQRHALADRLRRLPQARSAGYRLQLAAGLDPLEALDATWECGAHGELHCDECARRRAA